MPEKQVNFPITNNEQRFGTNYEECLYESMSSTPDVIRMGSIGAIREALSGDPAISKVGNTLVENILTALKPKLNETSRKRIAQTMINVGTLGQEVDDETKLIAYNIFENKNPIDVNNKFYGFDKRSFDTLLYAIRNSSGLTGSELSQLSDEIIARGAETFRDYGVMGAAPEVQKNDLNTQRILLANAALILRQPLPEDPYKDSKPITIKDRISLLWAKFRKH